MINLNIKQNIKLVSQISILPTCFLTIKLEIFLQVEVIFVIFRLKSIDFVFFS